MFLICSHTKWNQPGLDRKSLLSYGLPHAVEVLIGNEKIDVFRKPGIPINDNCDTPTKSIIYLCLSQGVDDGQEFLLDIDFSFLRPLSTSDNFALNPGVHNLLRLEFNRRGAQRERQNLPERSHLPFRHSSQSDILILAMA